MQIEVYFLPRLLRSPARSVCIVVDVLRATSTIVTLIAGGADGVTVVAGRDEALSRRDAARAQGEQAPFVCGEVGGLPPPGFDYGNSAVEFSRLDVRGRRAVLFTSNGTKALVEVAAAPAVFVGALLNRGAVVRAAADLARERGLDLAIVCSGTELGTAFSLEDAYCAGALVEAATVLLGAGAELGDGARAAIRLYRSYDGDTGCAFREAEHGRGLLRLGFGEDLAFCARVDEFNIAPRVRREDGFLTVRA